MVPRRLHLPAPDPYSGPNRCTGCLGAGITGARYEMTSSPETTLVVDEVCPVCGGCGRAGHVGCRGDQHADPEAAGFDPYDDGLDDEEPSDEAADGRGCPSCGGKRWNAVTGFNDDRVTYLRVPCGCAESLMVEVEG